MGRIGLLVPSSNTTVEPEFYRALPRGVTLHVARLFLTRIAPESILKMVEDMETQARLLRRRTSTSSCSAPLRPVF